jgi:acyl-CoA synthetase (NDP forming)
VVSIGNQIDLTLGDYLQYLKDDRAIEVFACYVEGFVQGDGWNWLGAARRIAAGGRPVILYRAGRTSAGASAAASHTASIAGSYKVTRALAKAAGVMVAESIGDFDDLIRLTCLLRNRTVTGPSLGALSNAGFESVAFADRLGEFRLAKLQVSTREILERLLEDYRLENIVTVSNPLDVTPILDDEAFALASRALIEDESVDLAAIGCVPLTGALNTLAGADNHREEFRREGSLALRLARLWRETRKAWVVVVDGGALYDPMARFLEESGIPTFRSADRALRILNIYYSWLHNR